MEVYYWSFEWECSDKTFYFEKELQKNEQIFLESMKFWKEKVTSYLGCGNTTILFSAE